MGHFAQLAEARVTRVERLVPRMIESFKASTLAPFHASVDALTLRVKAFESRQRRPSRYQLWKPNIAGLHQDINYLKSVDFNDIIRMAYDGDAPRTSKIPPATTRMYKWEMQSPHMGYAETEEKLVTIKERVEKEYIFGNLPNLVGPIVLLETQISSVETPKQPPQDLALLVLLRLLRALMPSIGRCSEYWYLYI